MHFTPPPRRSRSLAHLFRISNFHLHAVQADILMKSERLDRSGVTVCHSALFVGSSMCAFLPIFFGGPFQWLKVFCSTTVEKARVKFRHQVQPVHCMPHVYLLRWKVHIRSRSSKPPLVTSAGYCTRSSEKRLGHAALMIVPGRLWFDEFPILCGIEMRWSERNRNDTANTATFADCAEYALRRAAALADCLGGVLRPYAVVRC